MLARDLDAVSRQRTRPSVAERSEVALLESFTSQMFARRGGYGSNMDWATDVWLALQHAHVPTDILFEETLIKNGLSGRKVLVHRFLFSGNAGALEPGWLWSELCHVHPFRFESRGNTTCLSRGDVQVKPLSSEPASLWNSGYRSEGLDIPWMSVDA